MLKAVTIGDATFTIEAVERDGGWHAEARAAGGDRLGPVFTDVDAARAMDRAGRWLVWQREHDDLLRALQEAEHSYHRTIAGSAFASASDGPSAIELQTEALRRLERARLALDDVRARKPE